MSRQVKIVDYNPKWSILFENEKRLILDAIGHIITRIEHIGSTAVPNLGAKPIIDMMAAIYSLNDAEKCIKPLQKLGYEYIPKLEVSIPERRYFHKGKPPKEQHYHLHMVELKSSFWKKQLLFRDYLRNNPEIAKKYQDLKERLASSYEFDREGYTEAKTSFIVSIIAKAEADCNS